MFYSRNLISLFIISFFYKNKLNGYEVLTEEKLLKFYKNRENESFHARNCYNTSNKSQLPIRLNSMEITPHPVELGRLLIVNISLSITEEIGKEQIEIGLSIRLKTPLGYTELCSIVGDEFCHTNDLCHHLEKYKKFCKGQRCQCPIPANNYTLTQQWIEIKPFPFDLNGSFEATITLKEQGKHLGCIEANFCIGSCVPPFP